MTNGKNALSLPGNVSRPLSDAGAYAAATVPQASGPAERVATTGKTAFFRDSGAVKERFLAARFQIPERESAERERRRRGKGGA